MVSFPAADMQRRIASEGLELTLRFRIRNGSFAPPCGARDCFRLRKQVVAGSSGQFPKRLRARPPKL